MTDGAGKRALFMPDQLAFVQACRYGGATKTYYEPGQAFDFTLTLMGKAVDFLPYFILAFREVAYRLFACSNTSVGLQFAHPGCYYLN